MDRVILFQRKKEKKKYIHKDCFQCITFRALVFFNDENASYFITEGQRGFKGNYKGDMSRSWYTQCWQEMYHHEALLGATRFPITGQQADLLLSRSEIPVAIMALQSLLGGSDNKESARNAGDPGSTPGSGRSPGAGKGDPVSLPGESYGQRSLVGHGASESDMTELLTQHFIMAIQSR